MRNPRKRESKEARTLGKKRKASLILRSVRPLFEFQCARWPAQISYMKDLDALQRKMTASAFGIRRLPGDTMQGFNQRCSRLVAPYIGTKWSHIWCHRINTWQDHMRRHPDLWPARISAFQDAHWLQMRRLECGSASILAGHTRTRARRAKVERRWHDGLAFAREYLAKI